MDLKKKRHAEIFFCILAGLFIATLDTPIIYVLVFCTRRHFRLKGAGAELDIHN